MSTMSEPDQGADPGPLDLSEQIEASETFSTLTEAIDHGLVVLARYATDTEPRSLCPERIGIDNQGHYQVEAFQISGPSTSGLDGQGWRCFHLSQLMILATREDGWISGPRDTARSSCFHLIVHPVPGTA